MVPLNRPYLTHAGLKNLGEVIESGWWTTGSQVEALEEEFAEYIGVKHAIAVSSCSAGLHMTMCLSDVRDKKLYTTPLTFCSTVNGYLHAGGTRIVFIDVGSDQNINVDKLEEAVWHDGGRGIILPVHFGGKACAMDRIVMLAQDTRSILIEDCAHAVETTIRTRHVGTFGAFGVFSFNPTKNVTAPEMGMITTNNQVNADLLKKMRLHCISVDAFDRLNKPGQYDVMGLGFKYNPTDIEAVFARDALDNVEERWARRVMLYTKYSELFRELEVLGKFNGFRTKIKIESEINKNALHLYNVHLNHRNSFIERMRDHGICCGIHYKPVHQHSFYKGCFTDDDLPMAEWTGRHTCSLPMGPGFTEQEEDYIIKTIRKVLTEGDHTL